MYILVLFTTKMISPDKIIIDCVCEKTTCEAAITTQPVKQHYMNICFHCFVNCVSGLIVWVAKTYKYTINLLNPIAQITRIFSFFPVCISGLKSNRTWLNESNLIMYIHTYPKMEILMWAFQTQQWNHLLLPAIDKML